MVGVVLPAASAVGPPAVVVLLLLRTQRVAALALPPLALPMTVCPACLPPPAPAAVDIALPEERIALEVDGPHHFTANTFKPMGDMYCRWVGLVLPCAAADAACNRLHGRQGWDCSGCGSGCAAAGSAILLHLAAAPAGEIGVL